MCLYVPCVRVCVCVCVCVVLDLKNKLRKGFYTEILSSCYCQSGIFPTIHQI